MTVSTRYALGDWIATPYPGLQWGYVTDIINSGGPFGQPAIRYVVIPYTTDAKVEHDWSKTALVDEKDVIKSTTNRPPWIQLAQKIDPPRLAKDLTGTAMPQQ